MSVRAASLRRTSKSSWSTTRRITYMSPPSLGVQGEKEGVGGALKLGKFPSPPVRHQREESGRWNVHRLSLLRENELVVPWKYWPAGPRSRRSRCSLEILAGCLNDLSAFISCSSVPLGRANVLFIVGGKMIGSCHVASIRRSIYRQCKRGRQPFMSKYLCLVYGDVRGKFFILQHNYIGFPLSLFILQIRPNTEGALALYLESLITVFTSERLGGSCLCLCFFR